MPDLEAQLARLSYNGPHAICENEWRAQVKAQPGVYRLRVFDDERESPRPISRAGGLDSEGVLHIGESGNLRRRLRELQAAIWCKPSPHRAGWEYSEIGYDFTTLYPAETLVVDVLHVETKELAEALELALCEVYRWRFKDRPPLSGSSGKYRKVLGGSAVSVVRRATKTVGSTLATWCPPDDRERRGVHRSGR